MRQKDKSVGLPLLQRWMVLLHQDEGKNNTKEKRGEQKGTKPNLSKISGEVVTKPDIPRRVPGKRNDAGTLSGRKIY